MPQCDAVILAGRHASILNPSDHVGALNRAFVDRVLDSLHLRSFAGDVYSALTLYAALFVIMYVLEWRAGSDMSRYRSRHFATDLFYRLYFSAYMVALYLPLSVAAKARWPALDLHLLNAASVWIAIPAYLLIFDFLSYWIHRFQHTRVWWRFHRVHHSQESLTFATGYRNHPIDQMFAQTVTFVPLLLLGAPVVVWLPYSFVMALIDATHHANLRWRLGPLRKVIVSPVFHATHHSRDVRDHDSNFGGLFSIWDFLFGTAIDAQDRPAATGVDGWDVRESFLAHLGSPFTGDAVPPDGARDAAPKARA